MQLLLLPLIQKTTPMPEVRQAARIPSYIASFSQIINGAVFIGEGIMIGTGSFLQLSIGAVLATAGCVGALQVLPYRYGISGVWFGLLFWNLIRLASVVIHQWVNGPLAPRVLQKQELTLPMGKRQGAPKRQHNDNQYYKRMLKALHGITN
jgi:hypothetical protein